MAELIFFSQLSISLLQFYFCISTRMFAWLVLALMKGQQGKHLYISRMREKAKVIHRGRYHCDKMFPVTFHFFYPCEWVVTLEDQRQKVGIIPQLDYYLANWASRFLFYWCIFPRMLALNGVSLRNKRKNDRRGKHSLTGQKGCMKRWSSWGRNTLVTFFGSTLGILFNTEDREKKNVRNVGCVE